MSVLKQWQRISKSCVRLVWKCKGCKAKLTSKLEFHQQNEAMENGLSELEPVFCPCNMEPMVFSHFEVRIPVVFEPPPPK